MKEKIDLTRIPQHIAIIMDGNGRWAKEKGKERIFGHKNALKAVRDTLDACEELKIPYITLYTFSTENWSRPTDEVDMLMNLLSETLLEEAQKIFSKGLRLHVIGEIDRLPSSTKENLNHVIELTQHNSQGNLVLALSYSSQKEMINAVKEISRKAKEGTLDINNIDEAVFENHLYTKGFPPVDLLIRTSGEVRISNFLLWQIAYAELQFLDMFWPDFSKEDFYKCIIDFQKKERRFGKTSEQIKNN